MNYLLAADIVVIFHLLWIIFLIFGAVPGRRYKWIRLSHMGGLVFAVLIQLFGWYCPLTHLEIWLRRMHGPSMSYAGSFIIHYVESIVYINIPQYVILLLTVLIAFISVMLYTRRSSRKEKAGNIS